MVTAGHLVVVCNEMRSVKDNHIVINIVVVCNEMRSVKDNHKAIHTWSTERDFLRFGGEYLIIAVLFLSN